MLPAAIGLEAMAQAASALARQPMRGARRVSFGAPVVIPTEAGDGAEMVLHLRARVRADGVETILRAGAGDQLAECGRAVFVSSGDSPGAAHAGSAHPGGTQPAGASRPGAVARSGGSGLPASAETVDGADLYGSVCFSPGTGEYVWDIHGYDPAGHLVIAWIGLRMRDAGPLPGSGPSDGYLLPPDVQPAGVAADRQAFHPAAVPQQQVESLSRAR